jgi:DNA mismatch repair protein MutL
MICGSERQISVWNALDVPAARVGGREYVKVWFVSVLRERRTTSGRTVFSSIKQARQTIAGVMLEGRTTAGIYPVAFLFIEVPVEEIDVNVHPAKTEIRFSKKTR